MVRQQKKDASAGDDPEAEAADAGEDGGLDDGPSDAISAAFACREFDALLAFTRHGFVHAMQTLDVPMGKRSTPGASITDLVPDMKSDDQITSVIAVPQGALKDQGDEFAVIVTKNGNGKRVPLSSFRAVKHGKPSCAFSLDDGDELRWVHRAAEQDLILMASASGMGLCFPVAAIPHVKSLKAKGRPLMKLKGDVLGSCAIAHLDKSLIDDVPVESSKASRAPSGYQLFLASTGLSWKEASKSWGALDQAEKDEWQAKAGKAAHDASAVPDKASSSKRPRPGAVDDDDSDNDVQQASGLVGKVSRMLGKVRSSFGSKEKPDPEDEAEDAEGGDEEEDGDQGEEDKDSEDGDADAGEGDGEADAESKPQAGEARACPWARANEPWSVMIITGKGCGKRVNLSELAVSTRRNRLGKKIIKMEADDTVSSLHVTLNDTIPRIARKPRDPALLYQDSVLSVQPSAEEAPAPDADVSAEAVFAALSKDKQTPFFEQHAQEMESYKQAVEDRRAAETLLRDKLGQVLLCTAKGSVKRIHVALVDVRRRTHRGAILMKVPPGDELISAALLSSVEAEQDEIAQEQEQDPELPAPAEEG